MKLINITVDDGYNGMIRVAINPDHIEFLREQDDHTTHVGMVSGQIFAAIATIYELETKIRE